MIGLAAGCETGRDNPSPDGLSPSSALSSGAGQRITARGLPGDIEAAVLFAGDANLMAVLERTESRPGEIVYLLMTADDGRATLRVRFDAEMPRERVQPIGLQCRVDSGASANDEQAAQNMLRGVRERLAELAEREEQARER